MPNWIDRSTCRAARHGTYSDYQRYGCRCPDAREDWRLYAKRRREGRAPVRRVNATGTLRRIRALFAIGHTSVTIATAAGHLTPDSILNIASGRRWVAPRTAAAVAAAYDALSMTPGDSDITRRRAANAGYDSPLAWDDETIDDPNATPLAVVKPAGAATDIEWALVWRISAGEHPPAGMGMNTATRLAVIKVCAGRGESDQMIAHRLRLRPRSVQRIREAHGIPAGVPRTTGEAAA